MKTITFRSVLPPILGLLALALAGCPENKGVDSPDTAALPSAGSPAMPEKFELKTAPFEKRTEFTTTISTEVAKLDAQIADVNARQAGQTASESRTKALDELKSARTDLDSKLGTLSNASAETWVTVRDQVTAALSRVQSALEKAQSA